MPLNIFSPPKKEQTHPVLFGQSPQLAVGDGWTSFFSALQSKKRFEREWREAERAAQYAEKTDQDINATKADVEKVTERQIDYLFFFF